jgi:transcriptional regulator with XRE-family HTH domain
MNLNLEDWLQRLSDALRELRIQRNLGQSELAAMAGISRSAVQNLERGSANLTTLVRVVRALGREDWLDSLRSQTTINPLHMRSSQPRQRASRKRRGHPPT